MRLKLLVSVASVLCVAALVAALEPAGAAKSKMGCEIGQEVWNAQLGKCEPGTSKWKRAEPETKAAVMESKPDKKAAKKKAPAKKK